MAARNRTTRQSAPASLSLLCGWSLVITLLLVQRPLSAPNIWWTLAQGREVVSGTYAPSRSLLSLESCNDADWCGGVPFYLGWMLGGIQFLAAIPLLVALGLVAHAARRVQGKWPVPLASTILILGLWTIREGLQPVPQLFDLLGMVTLFFVVQSNLSVRGRFVLVLLSFAVWANLGPRPLVGLLWLLGFAPEASRSLSASQTPTKHQLNTPAVDGIPGGERVRLVIAALLGGLLTPRGVLTWRDSWIGVAPAMFENPGSFGEPGWRSGLLAMSPNGAELAFLLLWCVWVGMSVRDSRAVTTGTGDGIAAYRQSASTVSRMPIERWCLPLLLTALCRDNLPIGSIWILLAMLARRERPPEMTGANSAARDRYLTAAVMGVTLCLAVADAYGSGPSPHRFGWGISHELNPGLLDDRILSFGKPGTVGWAPDGRSAGLVSWLKGSVKLVDHPQRALIGSRGRLHASLIMDLCGAHRAGYRRDDGTWGGSVRQLSEWNVSQLFIPMEMSDLLRALSKTSWQPADLDSPTVPFVSADDPSTSTFVLETLRQQAFVEFGPWQPTSTVYSAEGLRTDWVEKCGGGPDPAPAILQSRFFRALDLPTAALRALLPIRQRCRHRSLSREFAACQRDLAYQEWSTFGGASYFRRLLAMSAADETPSPPWAMLTPEEVVEAELWVPCVRNYSNGKIMEATQALSQASTQQRYAMALLWLELGQSTRALDHFRGLSVNSTEPALRVSAEYWQQRLTPFGGE